MAALAKLQLANSNKISNHLILHKNCPPASANHVSLNSAGS